MVIDSIDLANLWSSHLSPQNKHAYDDDIDDIMASIMQGNREPVAPPQPAKRPVAHLQTPSPRRPVATHTPSVAPVTAHTPSRSPQVSSEKRKKKSFPIKSVLSLATFVAVLAGGFFLWNGPISALFKPPSPFDPSIAEKMKAPLYYPTKLPGSYKIELGSINQPESSVVVYTASDDEGKKLNISLQEQPKGLKLEPLYKVLSNLKEVDTKFGTIKYGASEDNVDIVNILTGETWVIITAQRGQLSDSDVQLLVNSLQAE